MRYKIDPETGKKIPQYVDGRLFNGDDRKSLVTSLLGILVTAGAKVLLTKKK